jgi:hypothetical protein
MQGMTRRELLTGRGMKKLGGRWLKVCGWLIVVQLGVYLWVGLLSENWLCPTLMGYQVLANALMALPLLGMVRGRFA